MCLRFCSIFYSVTSHHMPCPLPKFNNGINRVSAKLLWLQQSNGRLNIFVSLRLTESKILLETPADTFHLILHCPATDFLCRSLFVSLRPLVQALESFPASGATWSSAMPPSHGRGRVTTTRLAQCPTYC